MKDSLAIFISIMVSIAVLLLFFMWKQGRQDHVTYRDTRTITILPHMTVHPSYSSHMGTLDEAICSVIDNNVKVLERYKVARYIQCQECGQIYLDLTKERTGPTKYEMVATCDAHRQAVKAETEVEHDGIQDY